MIKRISFEQIIISAYHCDNYKFYCQTALPVKLLPEVLAYVGGRRVPVARPPLPAPLPPLVVAGDAVIPAPLKGTQIKRLYISSIRAYEYE